MLIIIIALIASIRISRVVSEKGYDPCKAKRYPGLYAGTALLSGFIFARGSDAVLVALHASEVVRVFFFQGGEPVRDRGLSSGDLPSLEKHPNTTGSPTRRRER